MKTIEEIVKFTVFGWFAWMILREPNLTTILVKLATVVMIVCVILYQGRKELR